MGYVNDLVSIVIPVYNAEKLLVETLDSLAVQTYENIEVLLIDDGSKDSSKATCESFAEADGRFHYCYQDNAGAGAARNCGIDLARGEYLMFLDSDDLFEPDFVEKMHDAAASSGADVVTCRADMFSTVYVPGKGQLYHAYALLDGGVYAPLDMADRFFQVMTTCPWDKIFRAEHIEKEGLRFQNIRYSNDTYFVLVALLTSAQIAATEEVLVHYRYGSGGSLRDKMYLNPYCDLDALAALRAAFEKTEMASSEELCYGLDCLTASIVVMACLNLASQSGAACKEFKARLRDSDVPKPRSLLKRSVDGAAVKRALRYWAVTSISAEGFSWALAPLGMNGWRSASRSQSCATWLRVFMSPIAGAWARLRGGCLGCR